MGGIDSCSEKWETLKKQDVIALRKGEKKIVEFSTKGWGVDQLQVIFHFEKKRA